MQTEYLASFEARAEEVLPGVKFQVISSLNSRRQRYNELIITYYSDCLARYIPIYHDETISLQIVANQVSRLLKSRDGGNLSARCVILSLAQGI